MKKLDTFGKRLRAVRGVLTQAEFAAMIGVKQAMISRYEADKELPTAKGMVKIAQATRCPLDWLLMGKSRNEDFDIKTDVSLSAKSYEYLQKAAEYLRQTDYEETEEFIEMMLNLFEDRKRLQKVLSYNRFLKAEG